MTRVVPDQKTKFENDELFRKLSRESEVRIYCLIVVDEFSIKLFRPIMKGNFNCTQWPLLVVVMTLFKRNAKQTIGSCKSMS